MADPKQPQENEAEDGFSRREFLTTTGAGAAALAVAGCASGNTKTSGKGSAGIASVSPQPPFDSIRDWMAALDANGMLLRLPEIDQDAYESTAMVFRLSDKYSMYGAPALMFDRVKIDGEWVEGPVLGNVQGHWNTDCLIWGLDIDPNDHYGNYRRAKAYMHDMLEANGGAYPMIDPVVVERDQAPVKEVVLEGDDIDITKFAFVKTNPTDGGRYINTGSIFTSDPEMGVNFGTYRCQIKGPRKIGVNPEPGQTGYKMLMAAKERGDKVAKVAIVLGQDPVTWMVSGTRVAPRFGQGPIDEFAVVGGMRGKAVETIQCETNDMMIPAHAEMVIEGEVPLQEDMLPEGPFGEMFGYMGAFKEENFWMNVTRVTHRENPWLMNAYTGMQRGMVTAPMDALYEVFLKRFVPNITAYHNPQYAMGLVFMAIDKKEAGEGIKAGKRIADFNPIAKIVIVVDSDVDVLNHTEMLAVMGARWQPSPAAKIIDDAPGLFTDPSQVTYGRTSKIVIDATRQWADEGGQEVFPGSNRELLVEGAPDVFDLVDAKYGDIMDDWEQV